MTVDLSPLFSWRGQVAHPESDLTPTQRLVALTLSLHMNDRGGSCFPSADTLAGETGLHRATVIRGLQELEQAGWLSVSRSSGRSNRYTAVIPNQSHSATGTSSGPVAQDDGTRRTGRPTRRTGRPEDVNRTSGRSLGRDPSHRTTGTEMTPVGPAYQDWEPDDAALRTRRTQ